MPPKIDKLMEFIKSHDYSEVHVQQLIRERKKAAKRIEELEHEIKRLQNTLRAAAIYQREHFESSTE